MLDIFVSYSRKNLDFVQHLSDDLEQSGKQIWFDKKKEPLQGIPAGSLWWDEIKHGIETTDNFLMIISPESMMSPYCHAEVAHALKHNKRIVTLLYCHEQSQAGTLEAINSAIDAIESDLQLPDSVSADIDNVRSLARRNWLALSQIQFVSYVDVRDWQQWLKQVIDAVDLDIQWVRLWSQFRQAVQIWEENDYSDDFLWSEARLKPVREMVEKRGQALNDDERNFIQPEQERLYRQLEDINLSHQARFKIGEDLNRIGDIRPGVGVKDGKPDMLWLPVNGFRDKHTYYVGTFEVSDFYISKYLTTKAQLDAFLASDWDNAVWWHGFPMDYQPQNFVNVTNGMDNAPRDKISWYQSVAFSRWMTEQFKGLKIPHPSVGTPWMVSDLNDDRSAWSKYWIIGETAEIRLPTEWEWQWVAQGGAEGREYPWGQWDEHPRANTTEAGLSSRSTAVGMYPHGAAICGALDVAGNLWEWCLNDFSVIENIDGYNNGERKVLRGGAFSNKRAGARYRNNNNPYYEIIHSYGCRVVVAPILRQS